MGGRGTERQFAELSPSMLRALADAVERGRHGARPTAALLVSAGFAPEAHGEAVAAELGRLIDSGTSQHGVTVLLRAVAAERELASVAADRYEVVWSGPEGRGAHARRTSVVVQELFRRARARLLIASYTVDEGEKARALFGALAERLDAEPALHVRMFLHIARERDDTRPDAAIIAEFAERFRTRVWPGRRLPELFYDPRTVSADWQSRASLHAKCVVADGELALVTSANFSEAAHERNVEVGVLARDVGLAAQVEAQFTALVRDGHLEHLR